MRETRFLFGLLFCLCLVSRSLAVDAVAVIQRSPMITIAAANTPAAKRRVADFVCDGTNDEATILLALAKLRGAGDVDVPGDNQIAAASYKSQGGTIFFCSGEYYIDTTLTISLLNAPHAVRLDGEAGATIFINNTDETPGIVFDGQASTGATHGYNRPEVFNLTFVGNFDELSPATAHCGDLMQMNDVAFPHVQSCHFLKAGRDGFHMTTPNSGLIAPQNRIIDACQFLACARHGLYVEDSHDLMLSNLQIEENARKAGTGGAGLYIESAIGGTLTNIMSEDNQSAFNPSAFDFLIVDSGLNMIGCDADESCSIDVRTGLNLKMTNCHFDATIAITGTNSNIILDGCDAATSITCTLTPADQGTFTMSGGRTGTLNVDAGKVFLTNAKINTLFEGDMLELSVVGGYCTIGDFDQIQNASFVGLTKLLVKTDGTGVMGIEDSLSVIGCGFEPSDNYAFNFHNNARAFFQTPWDQSGDTITFQQHNSSQTGIRLKLDSVLRNPVIVIDEIDFLNIGGAQSGGSITVTDCDTAMSLCGHLLTNSGTISFTDCDGRGIMSGCTGLGTVTATNCSLYVSSYFSGNKNPGITAP